MPYVHVRCPKCGDYSVDTEKFSPQTPCPLCGGQVYTREADKLEGLPATGKVYGTSKSHEQRQDAARFSRD